MRERGRRMETSPASQFVREFLSLDLFCVCDLLYSSLYLIYLFFKFYILLHGVRLLGQDRLFGGKNLPVFICLTWTVVVSVSILFVLFFIL